MSIHAPDDHTSYCGSASHRDHLKPFLNWLLSRHHKQGGVTEIRILKDGPAKGVWSGYFDSAHREGLLELILPLTKSPRERIPFGEHPRIGEANIYFTMQPVNPDLIARSANEFGRCAGTSDGDVVVYSLFAVDADPVRPSGISATDAEKAEAAAVADRVVAWLGEREVRPFRADSGNGFHLLVPTTPYDDVPAASSKARTLLQVLDREFSNERAKVDTSIYNPSRILKVYGTLAMKGSDIPTRPHRYATVGLEPVSRDVDLFRVLEVDLRAHASATTLRPASPAVVPTKKSTGGGWDFETSSKVVHELLARGGFDHKVLDKPEHGRIFAFRECPHHDDPDGHAYECSVIVRPDGSFAAKCMHDDKAGWKEFKDLIGWAEHIGSVREGLGLPAAIPYRVTPRGLVLMKPTKDGEVPVPLTNFTAQIVANVVRDDGAERQSVFEIEARLPGQTTRIMVLASEYSGLNWVLESLGPRAVVYAGLGTKDQTRAAIQLLSDRMATRVVYTHTGWLEHDGHPVYLHAGGAIGAVGSVTDVAVALDGPFAHYALPAPPSGDALAEAVRASLGLLGAAPDLLTVPLLAAVYRSPLGTADFSLHLSGPTGQGKSVLAVLAQQHYGAGLDAGHIPGNWSSTANANEAMAFVAKDALFLVDDFAPGNSLHDTTRLHRDADRLFRNQGNGTGRGRMRPDSSLRPAKPPRGLIVSTGEDVPRGQSLRARLLVLEVSPGMVDWDVATRCQREAACGLYAASMAGYVRWLAARYDRVRGEMPGRVEGLRGRAAGSGQHKRTPGIVANLHFAVELFTEYATEAGAVSAAEGDAIRTRAWEALGKSAANQEFIQSAGEPAQRFLDLLNAAFTSGKAHVAGPEGLSPENANAWGWRSTSSGSPEPKGDRVGWLDESRLYLEPNAAYAVAQRIGNEGCEPLSVSSSTLRKRLHESGMLAEVDAGRQRLTVRRTLEGRAHEVLCVRTDLFGRPAPRDHTTDPKT